MCSKATARGQFPKRKKVQFPEAEGGNRRRGIIAAAAFKYPIGPVEIWRMKREQCTLIRVTEVFARQLIWNIPDI